MAAPAMRQNGQTTYQQEEAPRKKPTCDYVPFGAKKVISLDVDTVLNYIAKPTKTGAKPTKEDAVRFIKLCEARGLNPWEGDAYLVGYDSKDGPVFSLITAHQTFLKRAEIHPEYDGMESGVIVRDANGEVVEREGDLFYEDDSILGGWATVYFKNRSHPKKAKLDLSKFHKGNKFWNENPGGMICKCAEADALRSSFPNQLGGLYLREEIAGIIEDDTPKQVPTGTGRSEYKGLEEINRGLMERQEEQPKTGKRTPQESKKDLVKPDTDPAKYTQEQGEEIVNLCQRLDLPHEELEAITRKVCGGSDIIKTYDQAAAVIGELQSLVAKETNA